VWPQFLQVYNFFPQAERNCEFAQKYLRQVQLVYAICQFCKAQLKVDNLLNQQTMYPSDKSDARKKTDLNPQPFTGGSITRIPIPEICELMTKSNSNASQTLESSNMGQT
jgi:hypothetical protein